MKIPKVPNSRNKVAWDYQIDCLLDIEHELRKWDMDFVHSLKEQLAEGRNLSERQEEILERIYAEYI